MALDSAERIAETLPGVNALALERCLPSLCGTTRRGDQGYEIPRHPHLLIHNPNPASLFTLIIYIYYPHQRAI